MDTKNTKDSKIVGIREFARLSGIDKNTLLRRIKEGLVKTSERKVIGIPLSELKRAKILKDWYKDPKNRRAK